MIGALIAMSVLSLIGGLASTYYTNRMNKQLANQANALSYQQFLQSQAFNESERMAAQNYSTQERIAAQQYNTQERLEAQQFNEAQLKQMQEYNSPAAQSQRLRDAGINPASVISGDGNMSPVTTSPASSSGASVSGASSPGLPGMALPSMENLFQPQMSTGILDSVMSALDKREDIVGKNVDNQTRAARNKAELEKLIADKENAIASKKLTKAQTKKVWQELEGLRVQKSILDNELTMSKARADNINRTIQLEFDKYQLERDKHEFDKAAQRFTAELQERGMQVNEAQAQAAIAETMQQIRSMQVNDKLVNAQTVCKMLEKNGLVLDNSRKATENAMLQNEKLASDAEAIHQRAYNKTITSKSKSTALYRLSDQILWHIANTGAGVFKGIKLK